MAPKPHAGHAEHSRSDSEEFIRRFEDAWLHGQAPDIAQHLPADPQSRTPVLIELVHIELECRLKLGETVRVEQYLEQFPELAENDEQVLGLIVAEYQLRERGAAPVAVAEYHRRFPRFGAALDSRLRPSRLRSATSVPPNCPQCHSTIEHDGEDVPDTCPSCGTPLPHAAECLVSWRGEKLPRIGRFQLLSAVGRGAFGTVYRAHDTELDRIVAVKVPRSGRIGTKEDEDHFVREARSVAQLRHPAIVPVYEVGRGESFPYIVSEFIDGVTLSELLSARRLDFHEAAEIVALAADALQHAHQLGVVHRDLKPSNIMLEQCDSSQSDSASSSGTTRKASSGKTRRSEPDMRPRIMDFGLARRDHGEVTLTVEGEPLGTPAYMSPEQARGEAHRVDGRSDVYSLGIILYQLLVGETPFRGNGRMILRQVLSEEPRPPRRCNDRIPRDLETITLKCLAKEANRRYASAADLAADLRRWREGEPIIARRVGPVGRAYRWCRRKPAHAGLIALATLLLTGGIAVTLVWQQAERRRQQQIYEHLAHLRSSAIAQDALARAELAAARYASAEQILAETVARIESIPELQDLSHEFNPRLERVRRIVRFYRLADRAEQLAFDEDDHDAAALGLAALRMLHVHGHPNWWLELPTDDLTPDRRDELREHAYHIMLLLAGVQAKQGLMNFNSPAALPAYAAALDTLRMAGAFRESQIGRVLEIFCRAGLGQLGQLRATKVSTPSSAADYYAMGLGYFWISQFPNDPVSQTGLGLAKNLTGLDFSNALDSSQRMLLAAAHAAPGHFWTHFWLMETYRAFGNYTAAELAVNTCITMRPDSPLGYIERARTLVRQLQNAADTSLQADLRRRALEDIDRARILGAEQSDIYWRLAEVYGSLQMPAEMLEAWAGWVERQRPLHKYVGQRSHSAHRSLLDRALKDAQWVCERESDNGDARAVLAVIQWATDQFDSAEASAELALQSKPDQVRALVVRGNAALRRHDVHAAVAHCRRALATAPGHAPARIALARAFEALGDSAQSLAQFDQLLDQRIADWPRVEAQLGRARILARQQRHRELASALDAVREISPAEADSFAPAGN